MSAPIKAPLPGGPCAHCPYRVGVPSGIWAAHEYEKLPAYDGSIAQQAEQGAVGVHLCNRDNGRLCAGWIASHGARNLLGLRLAEVRGMLAPDTLRAAVDYSTDVEVFPSGWAAAEWGMRDIENPGPEARRAVRALIRRKRRREGGR